MPSSGQIRGLAERTREIMKFGNDDDPQPGSGEIRPAWRSATDFARRLVGSSWVMTRSSLPFALRTPEPPDLLQRMFPGSLLYISNGDWAADRYPVAWPHGGLWAVTSDLETGRRTVLSADCVDGITATLPQAVLASCAVRPTGDELRGQGFNILSSDANEDIMEAAYESTCRRLATEPVKRTLDLIGQPSAAVAS